jgi:sirohydrochlorin cobaltochelatase
MSSAPFVWRDDGRPDWAAMWSGFCELALFGGPPHRGPDRALTATATDQAAGDGFDAIGEIRRGIWETTGLYAEPAAPGWLAVTCHSATMAAWLCATIILENVEARCEEERLLVPADPSFTLKDQVKSVITVVAKTHHYWSEHVARVAGEG